MLDTPVSLVTDGEEEVDVWAQAGEEDFSLYTLSYLFKNTYLRNKSTHQKNVHSSIINNGEKVETTHVH